MNQHPHFRIKINKRLYLATFLADHPVIIVLFMALCIAIGVFLSLVLCSWINADAIPGMGLSTLFDYAINNPIIFKDYFDPRAWMFSGGFIGFIVSLIILRIFMKPLCSPGMSSMIYVVKSDKGINYFDNEFATIDFMVSLFESACDSGMTYFLKIDNGTVITMKPIAVKNAFDLDNKTEAWCNSHIPLSVDFIWDNNTTGRFEFGVYHENDGTYTMEVFDGSDIVVNRTINI